MDLGVIVILVDVFSVVNYDLWSLSCDGIVCDPNMGHYTKDGIFDHIKGGFTMMFHDYETGE